MSPELIQNKRQTPGADVFAYPVESRLKQMSRLRACFITIIYLIVRAWATLFYALLPKEK